MSDLFRKLKRLVLFQVNLGKSSVPRATLSALEFKDHMRQNPPNWGIGRINLGRNTSIKDLPTASVEHDPNNPSNGGFGDPEHRKSAERVLGQIGLQGSLEWLVRHSIETASISKAKGAELLGIPLIDMDEFLEKKAKR
jgi:hypothetical protein